VANRNPSLDGPTAADPARTNVTLLDVSGAWDRSSAHRRAATRELPLDLKRGAVSGLGILSLLGAAVMATYFVILAATSSHAPHAQDLRSYAPILGAVLLINLAMFGLTRARSINADVILRLGYLHYVVVALLLGLLRHAHAWPPGEAVRQWSPVAMWILLFGALVPVRPGNVLGWSLFAALMDPSALLFPKRVHSAPSASEMLMLSLSPFLAALMAYVIASVVYGLNDRIARAREFGSYRLVERLGQGGMAEVWRAVHHMLARPAAVKLIRPTVLSAYGEKESERLVRLFEREVQSTATLRSPHTIQVYDFGVARDGTFYYVMELLDGFDIQTIVEQFGKQPAERVVFLLRQVCHSLQEAHQNGFVHRDMKPGNIYVCRYGADLDFAKVLDFGLVLDRRPTAEELDEGRGQIGTPAVMAPEQVRFDAPVDQRTDIYALGCVAYWLLTGLRVFEAATRQDMLIMHAHQRPDPPSKRAKIDVPEALERLVMDCLDKNPDRRPQTAAELAARLAALDLEKTWSVERQQAWWSAART
jgi:serine/threonine-protein kinase